MIWPRCHVTDTENKSLMLTADQSGQVPLRRHSSVMSPSSGCNIESEYKSLKHDDPRPDHHRCSNVRSLPYWILLEVRMFCHNDHKLQRNQQNTPALTLIDVKYLMRPRTVSRLSLYIWNFAAGCYLLPPLGSVQTSILNEKIYLRWFCYKPEPQKVTTLERPTWIIEKKPSHFLFLRRISY